MLNFHIIGELRQGIEEHNRIVCCRSAKQVNIKIAPWKLKLPRSQSEKVKVSVPHADETQNDRDHTLKHYANSQKLPNHSNTLMDSYRSVRMGVPLLEVHGISLDSKWQ